MSTVGLEHSGGQEWSEGMGQGEGVGVGEQSLQDFYHGFYHPGNRFFSLILHPPPNTIHSTSGTWKKSMSFTSGPPDVNALSQKTAVLSLDHMSSPVSRE